MVSGDTERACTFLKIKVGPGIETEKTLPDWLRMKERWNRGETAAPAGARPALAPWALSLTAV